MILRGQAIWWQFVVPSFPPQTGTVNSSNNGQDEEENTEKPTRKEKFIPVE